MVRTRPCLRCRSSRTLSLFSLIAAALLLAAPAALRAAKAPPERTYSKAPYVHRIVLLDEDGATIRAPRPGDDPAQANTKPFSMRQTCGKCHSDYETMTHGWHFNFADPDAPHGRPGEPWILTDPHTRTQLPLSYRGWGGSFHPYEVGINDFNFALRFGRHHTGGGALAQSEDLRFKMSGAMEIDCLICHTADDRYDPVARVKAIETEQNFKYAPVLAAFLGKVTGSAARLRDNYDPTGPDARRAPKVQYDWSRFDDLSQVHFDLARRVPNERCYFCHTTLDAGSGGAGGAGGADNAALESRFRHDGDIHLAKGMQCVDCHQHGADHMVARGYEGEYEDRVAAQGADQAEKSVQTLSCQGCHYGTETLAGGRKAAPRPVHKGLPTLHFDLLTCTACHSGPAPQEQATLVQTAMAHKLGLPRHHTADAAAPTVQQPVFLRDERTGKLTPYRVLYSSYWGRLAPDGTIDPIAPEQVLAAGTAALFGPKPDARKFEPMPPLSDEQIAQVLEKLASAAPPKVEPADVVTGGARARATTGPATTPATTAPATSAAAAGAEATEAATGAVTGTATAPATGSSGSATTQSARSAATASGAGASGAGASGAGASGAGGAPAASAAPSTQPAGEPVYVTGGKVYRRGGDGGGKLESFEATPDQARYAWPLAHDVRPAQQALGARGCTECHSNGAPIFDGTVDSAAVLTAAGVDQPMHALRGDSMGALRTFARTYPLRPVVIVAGYASAGVLLLVLLAYGTRGVAGVARRRADVSSSAAAKGAR